MNGVIVINKPKGKTSHDMIYFCRKLFNIRKAGHTGTLDPNATGVLPVCIGNATKAVEYITNSKKRYRAQIIFGSKTDTLDCTGKIIKASEKRTNRKQLEEICKAFIGEIEQIPPMYSAVKINGKKLYELAREGIEIERKSRSVEIFSIDIIDFDDIKQIAVMDIECSKGTYIRTLCDDIGDKIGTYAHMGDLERRYSGGFDISESYTPKELEMLFEKGEIESAVVKTEDIYINCPKIYLDKHESFKVKNGMAIEKNGCKANLLYRVYDENERFICVSVYADDKLKTKTQFWS